MNVGFQRIARREKKAFLSDQCKDIEENNRMGKTRDLFKKMREKKKRERGKKRKKKRGKKENERYQGNISCKDGHNKGQKWYGSNRSRIN